MTSFYFNYKDLFKAPRAAIGPQRITLATFGVLTAHLVYNFFTYIALLLGGLNLTRLWQTHGLFPGIFNYQLPFVSYLVFWIGVIVSFFLILVMNTALCRAAYMFLRDNLFYTWKQAIRFSLKRKVSIAGTYGTFLFLIIPFIIGAIVMAAMGKIPWIGEILNGLATLPYIFAGMVLVFLTLSFIISVFLGPVIIAAAEEDGFGTAVQALHLTWGQPWRLVVYGFISLVMQVAGVFFFAFVLKIGLIIYSILFMPLMHSLAPILDAALYYVQQSLGSLDVLIRELIGESGSRMFYLKRMYISLDLPLSTQITSYIVYFFLMIAGYMTIGYGYAVANTSLVISYIIYSKKLTTTNLLERPDSEILEEEDDKAIDPESDDVKHLDQKEDNDKK